MREDIENVEASKPAHQIIYTTYNCNHEKKKKKNNNNNNNNNNVQCIYLTVLKKIQHLNILYFQIDKNICQ